MKHFTRWEFLQRPGQLPSLRFLFIYFFRFKGVDAVAHWFRFEPAAVWRKKSILPFSGPQDHL